MPENFTTFISTHTWILILAAIWTIPWKGVALWKAARNQSVGWFVVLLVINTLGILEIIYIFAFSKKAAPAQTSETKAAEIAESAKESVESEISQEPKEIPIEIKKEDDLDDKKQKS